MKWKREVLVVKNQNNYSIQFEGKEKKINQKDNYLIEAIEQGLTSDDILVEMIQKREGVVPAVAGLMLSQYIIDYNEFLEEDEGYFEIK